MRKHGSTSGRHGGQVTALLLVVVSLWGCSTVGERMKDDLERGTYANAILVGLNHLQEEPEALDRAEVQALVVEARYREALKIDEVDRYRAFLADYPDDQRTKEIRSHLEKTLFEKTIKKIDTLDAYHTYLKEFPNGPYGAEARERSANLAFRRADAEGTEGSYAAFERAYPAHLLTQAARLKRWSLMWQVAEEADTVEAYTRVAEALEGAPAADAARLMVERLRWESATTDNSTEAYLAFAKAYPTSRATPAARTRGLALGWLEASRAHTVDAYRNFRVLAADQPMAQTAFDREVELAWRQVNSEDKESNYRWYSILYNDTDQARTAEKRAADLAYVATPWATERPRATVNQIYDAVAGVVRIYVDATESSGGYIGGLSQQDFRIYENGREAEITEFLGMESERPVDIVMLIDISGSMGDEIQAVKNSAIYFAELLRFRQRDSAFGLVTYVDDVEQVFGGRNLTRSVSEFQGWVGSVNTNSKGRENPVQAISYASRLNFRPGAQRVFMLITDEPPNVPFDPRTRMTNEQAGSLMLGQQVTFYAVTPSHPSYQGMVQTTRGTHFDIDQASRTYGFPALMEHIANLLSLQYQITYRSPRAIPRGGARNVRVRVDRPGVWVDEGRVAGDLLALLADPQNPCRMLAVTRTSGLFSTSNCASGWSPLSGQPEPKLTVKAVEGTWAPDGTVYLHTTGGAVWVLASQGRLIEQRGESLGPIELVRAHPSSTQTVWALAGRQLHTSTDAGLTWETFGDPFDAQRHLLDLAVDPHLSMGACIVDQEHGVVCARGTQWPSPKPDLTLPLPLAAGTRLHLSPTQAGLGILAVPDRGVYRTTLNGARWFATTLPPPADVPPGQSTTFWGSVDAYRLCQMTREGLYCSGDGALSWKPRNLGVDPRKVSHKVVASRGDDEIYLGHSDGTVQRLYDVVNREFVSGSVYFASGSDRPAASLLPFLQRIGTTLANDRQIRVRVEGHTDSDGSDTLNEQLSLRRATQVATILQGSGARAQQISTFGFGERKPLFDNTSAANKRRNRRVEILTFRAYRGIR